MSGNVTWAVFGGSFHVWEEDELVAVEPLGYGPYPGLIDECEAETVTVETRRGRVVATTADGRTIILGSTASKA